MMRPVLFIGKDTSLHEEEIIEKLGENAVIAPLHYNLPRASSLIYAPSNLKTEDIHDICSRISSNR